MALDGKKPHFQGSPVLAVIFLMGTPVPAPHLRDSRAPLPARDVHPRENPASSEEESLAALPAVTPILCEVLSCLFESVPAPASADSSSNELPAHVLAGKALPFAPASAAC